MKQSQVWTKTKRDAPSEEVAINAQLLIRAGFIHKEMAGVYAYLPFGWRVLQRIMSIIREEMNAIGGQELFLTALQDPAVWQQTGRWSNDVIDVWFKTKLHNDTELGLGNTHEEPLTKLMTEHVQSYRDLPVYVYQMQTKFRNELRSKSGILRSREFIMKDLYSFSRTQEEHAAFYEQAKEAYTRIFERVGIGEKTYITYASGGSFSKYSHEFQTLTDAGEDIVHICGACHIAVNEEIINEQSSCPQCASTSLQKEKAIEVGNIFNLGTRFSDPFGLTYTDEHGEKLPVIMGCYGIGPGRVMGTVVEVHHDDRGMIWPKSVAPFAVHLVSLCSSDEDRKQADTLYTELTQAGIEVLYDDRPDVRAGEKFADSDLIGIPTRLVISAKTIEKNEIEVKQRHTQENKMIGRAEIIMYVKTL